MPKPFDLAVKNKAVSRIEILVQEDEKFSYENFSTKGEYGYPDSFSPDWIAWQTRVKNLLQNVVGEGSAPMEMLKAGLDVRLLGNGRDKFEQSKS